jgi:hypothetical protein
MSKMNSNIRDLFTIFCGFLLISMVLVYLGLLVPAIIVSFFGGLACLERAFRWVGQANTALSKVLAWGCGILSISPVIVLLLSRAVGGT